MRSPTERGAGELMAGLAAKGHGPLTIDSVMGGRLKLIQPEKGYRVGMDAVLLAAAVPAKEGETALDAGAASGVAALCLAARVPGVQVTAIEIQPSLVEIGRANIALNGQARNVTLVQGDRKSTRLNSSHLKLSRMPSSA